jgi:L,D-transpeptidase ErfK/SrfK
MNYNFKQGMLLALLVLSGNVFANAYLTPPPSQSLIGINKFSYATQGDTVVTIAKHYDLGFNALENANPHLDMSKGFPNGSTVILPTQHLLPNVAREGIVINLPEMRMYYFPADSNEVLTYPIGIGKIGKTIPITRTAITRKGINPTWTPPEDIRDFNLQQGIVLPKVMPAGPENPLGPYAIYMRIPTYLIHSTIFPDSVGKRASFGCIRMYQSDIEEFFPSIERDIPVVIINIPIKVGWQDDQLYMEAHPALVEHQEATDASLPGIVHTISEMAKGSPTLVDWQLVFYAADQKDGMPHAIGMKIPN